MSEKIIQADGRSICTESFGDPADPTILLIMGAMASMLWWDEEFCRKLAAGGRHVIRYDNRDTGRSVTCEPGHPDYSITDLADDAIGVLDAYGVERAHLVGMSLGGMLAQILALRNPGRVLTITMLASGPFADDPTLPAMDEQVLAYHTIAASLDWSDKEAVIEYMVGGSRLLAGSAHQFDEEAAQVLATREFERATNIRSMMNYGMLGGGKEWRGRLGEIDRPALVIHGTEDTVLPYPHGLVLARKISGATLVTLEGTGHELVRDDWDTIIDAIIRHTSIPPAATA